MPTLITIHLTATEPLFFNPAWPLEERFRQILARGGSSVPEEAAPAPYTLSPIWPVRTPGPPASPATALPYRWRVSLLDDALTGPFLAGLQKTPALEFDGRSLVVGQPDVQLHSYDELAAGVRRQVGARPPAFRRVGLKFLTPVLLRRHRLSFPLPDPVAVFHHYLDGWDTFAPRELWVNVNLLDAVEMHLETVDHQLETRRIRVPGGKMAAGFIGQVTYRVRQWQKLGPDFLAAVQMLARFGEYCGTGELTGHGLGQTRLLK
ncbi:MAG: CRISPR system precrRNA processing endoribonuclease RAMP protein Cas6 [Chloroflexi bacterium]|nr:MAG: CRISPR system precrRNA processing endoribonuclease RAMP protein Cas6 [Chloroflexota bacterium]